MSDSDPRSVTGRSSVTLQVGATHGQTDESLEGRHQRARIASRLFDQTAARVAAGRFEVLERLGSGAMGVVFRARDPKLDRDVAIKVLGSWHMTSSARRRRVLREARAMAKVSHPNVVTVHEVGELDGGVFIAMELVEGTTVTDWLATGERSWREVRDVFLAAGRGLSAAHAAGVYHRDFKPENVMIGYDGRVRVMDFGLACLARGSSDAGESVEEHGDATAPISQSGRFVGTPAYMAPERFDGVADARSDQFSFCVALFEALYGNRPFEGASLLALQSAMASGEIQFPARTLDIPTWLRRTVIRGLEADPNARHECMESLLEALTHDRVIGRRRTAATVVTLGAAVALGALAIRSEGPACRGASRAMAETWSKQRATDLVDAFVASGPSHAARSAGLAVARIDETTDRWIEVHTEVCERTVRGEQSNELLDRRMGCLDEQRRTIDTTLVVLEDADREVFRHLTSLLSGLPDPDDCLRNADLMPLEPPADIAADVRAIRALLAEADTLARAGKWPQAEAFAHEAVERAEHLEWAPVVAEALRTLGNERIRREEYPRAMEPLADGFFIASAEHRYELAAEAAEKLVRALGHLGRSDEAMTWSRHAELALERSGGSLLRRTMLEDAIASALTASGRFDEATARHAEAIALAQGGFPGADLILAAILSNSAQSLARGGNYEEAARQLERAYAILETAVGPEHPRTLVTLNNMGIVARRMGRLEEALAIHQRALEIWERDWGRDEIETLKCRQSLGQTLLALGRGDEALEVLSDVLERTRARGDDPRLWLHANNVGHALSELGRNDEALEVFEDALAISVASVGSDHVNNAVLHANIGSVLSDLGRSEEAIEHLERSLELRRAHHGPAHDSVTRSMLLLGIAESATGRHPRALELLRSVLVTREQKPDTSTNTLAHTLVIVAEAELASGNLLAARETFERAAALVDENDVDDETASRIRRGHAEALERDPSALVPTR
jgi:eukaryotic-like serine/threonine-protein kinase